MEGKPLTETTTRATNKTTMVDGADPSNPQRVTSDHPSNHGMILQPLLTYTFYALLSGTAENVKKAVVGHFTSDQITEAKNVLQEECNIDIIGPKQRRTDSQKRTQKEADCADIIAAISKLDGDGDAPVFVIDASHLSHLPRSHLE